MELIKLNTLLRAGFTVIFKPVAALLVAIVCSCFILKAQDTTKVRQLHEVQVWQRLNTLPASSSTPAQILKGSALDRLNSLSVADAIRYFSGAQLKDYGGVGGLKTVDIRSLGSSQTAVFYDGIQLGNAQNGQVDLSKFSMDNIGSIELYNAQKSTIFQPARGLAAGSSIYLSAKQPIFSLGQKDVLKGSFRTGSMGLYDPSVLWQHKINNNISSSVSSEYTRANGQYKFRYTNGNYDTTAVRNNGDIDALRLEAGLNGRLPDSASWSVKAYLYNSERGLPGAIVENRFDYHQREWDRNIFIQSGYEKHGKVYSLMLNAKYANDYMRYLDPDRITIDGFSESRYHQQEVYLSAANQFTINSFWNVVLSADYLRNTMQSNIPRFSYPTRNTLLAALATQLKWSRLNVQANLLVNFVYESTKLYTAAVDRTKYTPAVMASWQPFGNPDFHIRGFYKAIYRIPTFNELYYTAIGNADLKPEYSKQLDAGFTYQRFLTGKLLRHFSIQTDSYYNRVNNKILAVPSLNLQRWTMQNVSRVNIKGLETNIQSGWYVNEQVLLNAGLSYTYQQAHDATEGLVPNQQIPYVPVHSGSVLAGVQWQKFTFNYSFIYTGERYNQKANIPENYVEPWYTHDVSANWNTPWQKHQVKLGIDVNNLFNQYYDVITNFPMPGRYYRFKISFTY